MSTHYTPTIGAETVCGERFGDMTTRLPHVTCTPCLHGVANQNEAPAPQMPQRQVTLETAIRLTTGQRREEWGPVETSFQRIADGWEPIFGVSLTPHQVALAMVWLKVARALESPESMDSYVDLAGYGALASELAAGGHA